MKRGWFLTSNLICMYRFTILVLFLNLWTTYSVEKRPKGQSTLSTRAWVKGISQNTCFFCLFVALFYIIYIFLFLNVENGILNFKSISKTAWLITNSSSGIVGMTNDAHLVLVKFLSFLFCSLLLRLLSFGKLKKIYTCSGNNCTIAFNPSVILGKTQTQLLELHYTT